MKTITRDTLKSWLDEGREVTLIDTLPPDVYAQAHIAGAISACVYQMDFLENLGEACADKGGRIVVYGHSAKSLGSKVAAEKLEAAGYTDVHDYPGGFQDWSDAGLGVERSDDAAPVAAPAIVDGDRPVDLSESLIEWVGRNLASKHRGALRLKSGSMSFQGGQPVGGSFTIDMNSIENHNIEESGMRQVLVDHLKSDDFFHVERYPEAVFQIKAIEAIPGSAPGALNYRIAGILKLKDAENELELAAAGGVDAEGRFVAQAQFDFDRTLWNVVYGSGRLFEKLGMHLVNDLISLQLKIVA